MLFMSTVVVIIFISMFISVIENFVFFVIVSSYVRNKVWLDLTWLIGKLNITEQVEMEY